MIGRKIIHLESVDSTNNYIAELIAKKNIVHGISVFADAQTNGKGQRGSVWTSNPGENLIYSLFLDSSNIAVKDQFILTQFISFSVTNVLLKYGIFSDIKWPNDIYVKGKKIAGILIENQINGSNLNGSIIGIGLNVNQTVFNDLIATSVRLEIQEFKPLQEVVFSLINELNLNWNLVVSNQFQELNELYLSRLWKLNSPSLFKDCEGEFVGVILGVDESGRLKMEKNMKLVTYDLKEISFLI